MWSSERESSRTQFKVCALASFKLLTKTDIKEMGAESIFDTQSGPTFSQFYYCCILFLPKPGWTAPTVSPLIHH